MLHDKIWRMNNLYRIINKEKQSIPFKLNYVQDIVARDSYKRKVILKARQLGMSTYAVINMIDDVLFTENLAAGIVSYSLDHAKHIYKRIIGHALDTMLPEYKPHIGLESKSASEMSFSNGSYLKVDTTLRGGSYQSVLVSEFGKTCARSPQKAEEIITGTIETIPESGSLVIESTGEGTDGYFTEIVQSAEIRGDPISFLDYKLCFFPWMIDPTYTIKTPIEYEIELTDYFDKLEKELGITITQGQRWWYAAKRLSVGKKMKQEYPSTVDEAFLSSSEAQYYAEYIAEAYNSNRCLSTSLYDALLPLYVTMDIGVNDLTVMVFFQIAHGEIRFIDYYEDKNKGVDFYAKFLLKDKPYLYHTIFLPHDATKRSQVIVENTYEREFRLLFSGTDTRFIVLPKKDLNLGIAHAKNIFSRCVFAINRLKPFLDHVSKYRKKWHEPTGKYLDEPLHDIHCLRSGTRIETDKGPVVIEKIAVGDKVLTPNGYKEVTELHRGKTKRLIKIDTSIGSIECTPHHKIFTTKRLVFADELRYNDHLLTIEDGELCKKIGSFGMERGLGFKEYFLSMSQRQLSTLMVSNSKKTNVDIGHRGLGFCIEKFGNIIMEKFQRSTIFITLMEINQIIKSRIFNLFPSLITCGCTCLPKNVKNYQERASEKRERQPKLGIVQKREENGIASMVKTVLINVKMLLKHALTALKHLLLSRDGQSTALMHANHEQEEHQELIMKQENVKYVTKYLNAANTVPRGLVLQVAELDLDTEVDVYDLTVEGDHCYYANFLLLSNSNHADTFRYAAQAVTHIEAVVGQGGAMEKHKAAVAMRRRQI